MVLNHKSDYPSRWSTAMSVAGTIGCEEQALQEWVTKVEFDSVWRAGVSTDTAEKLNAL